MKSSSTRPGSVIASLLNNIPLFIFSLAIAAAFAASLTSCDNSVNSSNPRPSYTIKSDSIGYGESNSFRRDDTTYLDYSRTRMVVIQFEYKSTNPLGIEFWARNKNGGPDIFKTAYDHGQASEYIFVSDTAYPSINATSNIFSMTFNLHTPVFPGSYTLLRNLNLYNFE